MAEEPRHLDAGRKGKAVEHLVAATCILASGGLLNVTTSLVDDEGVDLVFHRRGRSATLAAQVKSRSTRAATMSGGQFLTDVRQQTFAPRSDLCMLFVVVDEHAADFGPVWLVPSVLIAERIRPNAHGRLRFAASAKAMSQDRWRNYRLEKRDLPGRLLGILDELDRRGR